MRLLGTVSTVVTVMATLFALATYEKVLLVFAASGSVLGGIALVWLFFLTKSVRDIQAGQSSRIDDLPPPGV